jgi:hypothetical protein
MTVFKKALPRRTFLRGIGATLALPLLDGMVPALARAQGALRPATRLSFVYVPNGIIMEKWTPAAIGAQFEMTPILSPLTPFRNELLVLSGLVANGARALAGEGAGEHARASATFLSGVHPKKTEGSDLRAGITVDQLVARELGKATPLASLEVAMDSTEVVGTCDTGYSCAYSNTLCWRSETTPIPMENQPRAVFERLFGDSDSTDPRERLARIQKRRSILDSVLEETARLASSLGSSDRTKLTEYLEAVRDIERRIQTAETQSARELPAFEKPGSIPATFTDHCKLMLDLQVLAYQTDTTRVATFMIGREQNTRVYDELGFSDPFHPLSHHQNDPAKIAKCIQINTLHTRMLAYFLDRMRSTPDGDGSLLDHSVVVYGSAISDGNLHLHDNLPILVAGGGSGTLKGGRHIRYAAETPTTNLYLTLLDKIGMPLEKFGDSNGKLDLASVA